jgi:HEPN domain-containing protein
LPRKTDSRNPADWLLIADSELEALQLCAREGVAYSMCRSKLAEVLEKVLKAELIRLGWPLLRTHDLQVLANELKVRKSDLLAEAKPLCNALAEVYFTDRYPGFDLEDPDWPKLRGQIQQVAALAQTVKAHVGGQA